MTKRTRELFLRVAGFDRGDADLMQHFTKGHACAALIVEGEELDAHSTGVLEAAAPVHVFAIPLSAENRKMGKAHT